MLPSQQLQSLYDSGIHFSISSRQDRGFDWKLGDDLNGYTAQGNAKTFNGAVRGLVTAVKQQYPENTFARDILLP